MSLLKSYKNPNLNVVVENSPSVLEYLSLAPTEVVEAYKTEVLIPLHTKGEFIGVLVSNPTVSNDVLCVYLSTGQCVFYEVTSPTGSSTPNYPYTYCSVFNIFDLNKLDSINRKSLVSIVRKNVQTLSEPVKQFILANKVTFFLIGAITAIMEFFNN